VAGVHPLWESLQTAKFEGVPDVHHRKPPAGQEDLSRSSNPAPNLPSAPRLGTSITLIISGKVQDAGRFASHEQQLCYVQMDV
jgi:hypothetical protein